MNLRAYIIQEHPRWDSYPESLRNEYLHKLRKEFAMMSSGPIGRAKVRFMKSCGFRVRSPQVVFDMAIESLKNEGVL